VGRVDPEDPHVPGGAHAEAFEDLDGRRLARAVGAEQRQHLTGPGRERDAGQDVVVPVSHP